MKLLLLLFVVGTGVTIEALDWSCGRRIEGVNAECAGRTGSCKWRVVLGDSRGELLRTLAFFPGLLVYLAAPVAALWYLAASRRAASWLAAVAALAVLGRFVFSAVFR
jgi:hypothetical protein